MNVLDDGFEAQAESLRDFGYSDVTAEMVKQAHAKWKAGEQSDGIIAMLCEKAFTDYPQVFGSPDVSREPGGEPRGE